MFFLTLPVMHQHAAWIVYFIAFLLWKRNWHGIVFASYENHVVTTPEYSVIFCPNQHSILSGYTHSITADSAMWIASNTDFTFQDMQSFGTTRYSLFTDLMKREHFLSLFSISSKPACSVGPMALGLRGNRMMPADIYPVQLVQLILYSFIHYTSIASICQSTHIAPKSICTATAFSCSLMVWCMDIPRYW